MSSPNRDRIKCYLVQEKSSHEGSGGGFTVVRFFHLAIENHTDTILQSVSARYRLMKGSECFQEDALTVGPVQPGQTMRSETFIRDSTLFDRIEWIGDPLVKADRNIPEGAVTFDSTITRPFNVGCLALAIGAAAIVGLSVYWYAFAK